MAHDGCTRLNYNCHSNTMKNIAPNCSVSIFLMTAVLLLSATKAVSQDQSDRITGEADVGGVPATKNEPGELAWTSSDPVIPPNFSGYFPDDPEAGKRLDHHVNNQFRNIPSDEDFLEAVRLGFRNMTNHRTTMLSSVGNKYIWNREPQNPEAIELMYHAVDNPNLGERHSAIYSGLSVVKPKPPAVLKALVDVAMTTDDPNDTRRIAWGASDQAQELIEYLSPYLASDQTDVREHARALKGIFSGELSAREYWRQNRRAEAEPVFGPQMDELRTRLANGSSQERHEVFKTFRSNHLDLLVKDKDAWLEAFIAASSDPDERVRRYVAQAVGSGWVWGVEEIDERAVDVLFKLAGDPDREVRYDANYYGLNRLPEDHLAQKRIDTLRKAEWKHEFERLREMNFKSIEEGKYAEVERFLEEIKPQDGKDYYQGIDIPMLQNLYDEISRKLKDAKEQAGGR